MKKTLALILTSLALLAIGSCGNWPYKPEQFIAPTPPAPPNAFVSKDSLSAFVGTRNVKFAYSKVQNGVQQLFFANFNDSLVMPKMLKKPSDKSDWGAWCPIISPDGNLVTYFLVSSANVKHSAAYVQKLDTAAEPVLLHEPGSDPHFYKDNAGALFITYADTTGFLQGDLSLIIGQATFKQQVDPVTGQEIGTAQKIADYPFYGGMSFDGKYICTGYSYAYFYNFTSQNLLAVDPLKQTCNPSMTPDTLHTGRMMFLNIGGIQAMNNMGSLANVNVGEHKYIFIVDTANTLIDEFSVIDMVAELGGAAGSEWQCPKWTNAPDFFCALTSPTGSGNWNCYVVRISDKSLLMLNHPSLLALDGTSKPYVYIGGN